MNGINFQLDSGQIADDAPRRARKAFIESTNSITEEMSRSICKIALYSSRLLIVFTFINVLSGNATVLWRYGSYQVAV
jgi:hypothetical protein